MNGDFLSTAATLDLDLGSGWISRYDAGRVGSGDVIMADELAGDAQKLRLNGQYLCDASVCIAGERFFAKIERLEPEAPPPAPPERGDEAVELLPFIIRLASIEVELGSMAGLGRYSFVDLEKVFSMDEDALLVVAGIPLAAGKIVVIGENFGLRIARRLSGGFDVAEMRTTGAVLSARLAESRDAKGGADRIKAYDFRMPDCFSRRGIVKAQAIHLEFLRTLADRLPGAEGLELSFVDQLAYHEWADPGMDEGLRVALLDTRPSRPRPEELPELPRTLFLRPRTSSGPLEEPIAEALRLYAEESLKPKGERPVIMAFDQSLRPLFEEEGALSMAASCLRNGWKRVADLRLAPPAEILDEVPGEEAAYRYEMILLARFEGKKGGRLDLVYPLRSLEACFRALNS